MQGRGRPARASLSRNPTNSLYCTEELVSRISAAARNLRIAASRLVRRALFLGTLLVERRRRNRKIEAGAQHRCAGRRRSVLEKRSPVRTSRKHIVRFHRFSSCDSNQACRFEFWHRPRNHACDCRECVGPLSRGRRTSGRSLTLLRQRDGQGTENQLKITSGNRC